MKYKDFYSHLLNESLNQKHISKSKEYGTVDGYVTDNPNIIENWFKIRHRINGYDNIYSTVAFLNNLNIEEEFRGRGYGKMLLEFFIESANELGAEAIYLISDRNEQNVVDLTEWYIRNGFEKAGWSESGEDLLIYKNEI